MNITTLMWQGYLYYSVHVSCKLEHASNFRVQNY